MLDVYRKALPEAAQQGQNMVVKFNPDDLKLILTSFSVSEECKAEIIDFLVNMEVGTCSCIRGVTGSECKHQAAIAKKFMK